MKKSEIYKEAIFAVVDSKLEASVKIEIIERLRIDKWLAEMVEENEEKEAEKA